MFEIKVIDFQTAIQVEHLITSSLKSVDTIIVFEKYCSAVCLIRVSSGSHKIISHYHRPISSSYLAVIPSAKQNIYI